MKKLIVLLALGAVDCGFTSGLRATYGSGSSADEKHFYNVPRTIEEAKTLGWQKTQGPPTPVDHLMLYCPPGRIVCVYYHPLTGYVTGVQIALPVDSYQWGVIKPERHFVLWHAPENGNEPATDYWTMTQFFAPEVGKGPTKENGAILQRGNVWLVGPDGKLMKIPENESELKNTQYKRQNCIPNMGVHYFYNMSPSLKCEEVYPWFLLVKDGKVIGVGFMAYGKVSNPRYQLNNGRQWYEIYDDPKLTFQKVIPDAPTCLTENMEKYGSVFIHVYYIDEPWTITCRFRSKSTRWKSGSTS